MEKLMGALSISNVPPLLFMLRYPSKLMNRLPQKTNKESQAPKWMQGISFHRNDAQTLNAFSS